MATDNSNRGVSVALVPGGVAGEPGNQWILKAEVDLYIEAKVNDLLGTRFAQVLPHVLREHLRSPQCRDDFMEAQLVCGGGCSTGGGGGDKHHCNDDTRLSAQRKKSLRRQHTHYFGFNTTPNQLPLMPQQTKTWSVPPFKLGRVIEYLYFRPTMDDVDDEPAKNWDDIIVRITGEDGILWAEFGGGRHMPGAPPCCLLEVFEDDCIGWGEGFNVTLQHKGEVGSPAMVSAAMDWHYIFPNQKSELRPNWCWPGGIKVSVKSKG